MRHQPVHLFQTLDTNLSPPVENNNVLLSFLNTETNTLVEHADLLHEIISEMNIRFLFLLIFHIQENI